MAPNIVKKLYDNTIRRHLPRKFIVFNSVPVARVGRLFDAVDEHRQYKEPNICAIRGHIEPGDRVVTIGGGFGVTAVVAARAAREQGSVIIYEADARRTEVIEETVKVNRVDSICDLNHAVVGQSIEVAGGSGVGKVLPASDLPPCDVLEMDCEGAEGKILDGLSIRPRILIVETHPEKALSTESIETRITDLGYRILSRERDPTDGHVLVATRTE